VTGRPRVWIALLLAAFAGIVAGCGAGTLPVIRSDADRLSVARRLHADGDDAQAIELLKTYTASASGAADVDQAIYLLGECYLAIKEWPLAANEFERLLRDYPESDSSASGSFRLGVAYFGQARKPDFDQAFTLKALDQWLTYLRMNPGHWRNAEAHAKILEARTRLANKLLANGNLYLKLRLFEPARFYFRRVIDEYPDTPSRARAELGLALADAKEKKRDLAIAGFRDIESRYAGQPVAHQATRERKRLED
jgi:outer membrane protein assembly factor BamD